MTALAQRALPPSVIYNPLRRPTAEWTFVEPQEFSGCIVTRGFTSDYTGGAAVGVLAEPYALHANVVLTSLSTAATSGCVVIRGDADQLVLQTIPTVPSGPQSLFELRRLSGLSWEQLAEMIGVERRSVHNWAAGKTIALKNLQRIGELLSFVRYMDRGNARENAALLLGPTALGETLFQLLAKGEFARARIVIARGPGRVLVPTPVADESRLGPERFGHAYERGQESNDDGEPIKVLSERKLRRVPIRKAPGR